jgi:hypothetical protein
MGPSGGLISSCRWGLPSARPIADALPSIETPPRLGRWPAVAPAIYLWLMAARRPLASACPAVCALRFERSKEEFSALHSRPSWGIDGYVLPGASAAPAGWSLNSTPRLRSCAPRPSLSPLLLRPNARGVVVCVRVARRPSARTEWTPGVAAARLLRARATAPIARPGLSVLCCRATAQADCPPLAAPKLSVHCTRRAARAKRPAVRVRRQRPLANRCECALILAPYRTLIKRKRG